MYLINQNRKIYSLTPYNSIGCIARDIYISFIIVILDFTTKGLY